ncbi:MAG: hypothetical protein GWN01_11835 [Nitrosopumilaceae archaeon]|nr:hypothetical protein [Nitrosopumilaceae archaeon]NIU01566.1 hypothetical protein [Nitrosopumilaceae archaeon]NIU88547.1 hypothetical protein [Nitrosopumilaceae archaeon]NIV66252.1 hypothetical protein [Nitrosopumilaceae archaeon]NIX62168.1 hypothetical protein [Nitrosopumilaceae archaeon]
MRLGSKSADEFIQLLNKKNEEIQEKYLKKMIELTRAKNVKVMLGDSSVIEQKTFDPSKIEDFFQKINNGLTEWDNQGILTSNNEDVRRIFIKFQVREGNYFLSGHLSIQFHVLLYYKPVHRVIECQKELSEIVDLTKDKEKKMADESDQFILNKLQKLGYTNLNHSNIFEIFFENDELREKIYKEIEDQQGTDFKNLEDKKQYLFEELDGYLMEAYHTSSVLIDDSKLISGEEGFLCTFDLEFLKNKTKEGLFDTKKIPDSVREKLLYRLEQVYDIMNL